MKNMPGVVWCRLFWLLILALLLNSHTLRAADYFVATDGSDLNDGRSAANPFKTFTNAFAHLSAGDALYIRGGVYREPLIPTSSGTADAPILITAYQNESVTITGADVLTNAWVSTNSASLNSANIYVTQTAIDLGSGRNQIFVDGEMMHEARFPNFGTNDLVHANFSTVDVDSVGNLITCTDWTNFPVNNSLVGAYVLASVGKDSTGQGYGWQTAPIISSSGSNVTVDARAYVNGQWFTDLGPGFIYGILSLLDTNEEWYLDPASSRLFMQAPHSDSPTNYLVEMKSRVFTLSVSNQNYITVRGLKLRAGAVLLKGTGIVFADNDCRYLSHYQSFPYVGLVPGTPNVWDQGIEVLGTNSVVQGCSIYDTASSGIFLVGATNVVTRNFIYNIDYVGVNGGSGGAGVAIDGIAQQITFNTFSNLAWVGISPNNANSQWGHTIMYNEFTKVMEMNRDGGGFYSATGNKDGTTRIAYNWFHDFLPFRRSAVCIYLDSNSQNYLVDHNVGFNEVGREGMKAPPNFTNSFFNNTLFNCFPTTFQTSGPISTNNLYLAWGPEQQLMDWEHFDFRLLTNSPAVDAGLVIPGITDGYTGSAPDLGAYETGGPYWVPGVNGWKVEEPGVRTEMPISWANYSAVVAGTLVSAGTTNATVYVVWGTSDAGTNFSGWLNATSLGAYATNPVSFAVAITNLTPGALYTYRFYATNANGVHWGKPQSFVASGGIWTWEGSSLWSTASRWRGNLVADGANNMADFATINISQNRTVTNDVDRTIGAMRFGDVGPSFDWTLLGAHTLTLSLTNDAYGPFIDVTNRSAFVDVVLAGTDGLEKRGPGRLLLYSNNTYTGKTTVSAGALMINGSIGGGSVEVKSRATLGGSGVINEPTFVQLGGIVSPGETGAVSVATLSFSDLTLVSGSLIFDLAGSTNAGAGINDLISLSNGVLTVSNFVLNPITLYVNPIDGFLTNQTYTLISGASAIVGDVSTLFTAPNLTGVRFWTNSGAGPYDVYLTVSNVLGRSVVWRGTPGNNWNVTNSPNWSNAVARVTTNFNQGDNVRFDDTTASYSPNLAESLAPSAVTIESSKNYTFGGSGKITGTASLTKRGAGDLTVNTTNDYTGGTFIEDGNLILTVLNALSTNSAVILGARDSNNPTAGALTLLNADQTLSGLETVSSSLSGYASSGPGQFNMFNSTNQVIIGPSRTLTVNGNVTIGNTIAPGSLGSFLSMSGGGTFSVNSPGGVFQLNANTQSGSKNYVITMLDMSGLSTANINLGTNGNLNVGELTGGDGGGISVLSLATNSTVTAGTVSLGNASGANPKTLLLGAGTNVFNVDTIAVGPVGKKDYGQIRFQTTNGTVKMRASDGASRTLLTIGANAGSVSGASDQSVEFTGHDANLLLSKFTVGEDSRGIDGEPYSSNYFGFSSGVLDATELRIGNRPDDAKSTNSLWYNVVNLSGGTVTISPSGLTMGTTRGTKGTSGLQMTELNISGGSFVVSSNIVLLTQLSTAYSSTSSINLTGGSNVFGGNLFCGNSIAGAAPRTATLMLNGASALLDMRGFAIGGTNLADTTADHFIDVLKIQAGTLRNVGQINGGMGLIKDGSGTLILGGTNTYTGNTVVNSGTLVISSGPQPISSFTVKDGAVLKVSVADSSLTAPLPGVTFGNSGVATLQFDFSVSLSSTVAPLTATNLTTQGGSRRTLINLTGPLALGQYPLIQYSGSIGGSGFGGFQLGTLPAGVSATLVNNSANHSVDLNVLSVSTNGIRWNGNNSSAWDVESTTNWLNGGSPAVFHSGDAVRFDDSASGTTAVTLDSLVFPGGMVISNISANYSISGSGAIWGTSTLTKQGSGTAILNTANRYTGASSVAAGKLVVSTAQQGGGAFTVADAATLGVTVTSSATMPVSTLTLGASTLEFNFADLLLSSVPVSVGTLTVNGAVSINLNGRRAPVGPFRLINYSAIGGSGSFTVGTLPPGMTATVVTNTDGTSIDLNVTAVAQNNLVWSGTVSGNWDVGVTANWLAGATASSYFDQDLVRFDDGAAGTTAVVLNTNAYPGSLTVSNVAKSYGFSGSGIIGGAVGLNKLGSGTLTLSNSNSWTYTGGTSIKNGEVTIASPNALPTSGTVDLGDASTVGKLTLNAASQTVGGLNIISRNASNAVTIGAGQTLTMNGDFVAAPAVSSTGFTNSVTFAGGGSLLAQGSAFKVGNTNSATLSGTAKIIVDMSALASANLNLGANGILNVGDQANTNGSIGATLILASNTTVTAKTLQLGGGAHAVLQLMKLGTGSNIFNVGTLATDASKDYGQISFMATNSGSLKMRGVSGGSSRASLLVASSSGNNSAGIQSMDLKGHTVDLMLSTLRIGQEDRGGGVTNYFGFDTGALDTSDLRLSIHTKQAQSGFCLNTCDLLGGAVTIGSGGIIMSTGHGGATTRATNWTQLNIGGGTVTIGGDVSLLSQNATNTANAVFSTWAITNGNVTVRGNIYCTIPILNPATHIATLTLDGANATLDLTGHSIGLTNGDTNSYVDVLNFSAGTLQNVKEINGGRALIKTGSGKLVLAGTNNYTGPTVLSNGILNVAGVLAGGGLVTVNPNALLTGSGNPGNLSVQGNGTVSPGNNGQGDAGTLTTSNLTLSANSTLVFDLSDVTTPGSGVNDLISMRGGTLTIGGPVVVQLNLVNGSLAAPGTYTIISNATAVVGDVGNFLAPRGATFRVTGSGPYNVCMDIGSGGITGQDIVWSGTNASPNWDVTTVNWSNSVSHAADTYHDPDYVIFNDFGASGAVNLTGQLQPSSVNVSNSTINYVFSGSGFLSGGMGLTKAGSGTLTLSNSTPNDYTGSTVVKNGTLDLKMSNVLPATTPLVLGDSNAPAAGSLLVNADQSVGELWTVSTNATSTNYITITSGRTLAVNGSLIAGNIALSGSILNDALQINGSGALVVNTNGGVFQLNGNTNSGTGNGTRVTVDMSALSTANISLGSAGGLFVGERMGGNGNNGGVAATLALASNSTITAGIVGVGNSSGVNFQTLQFGSGSNVFNVNTFLLGTNRDYGQVSFKGATGSLKIRAFDGVNRAALQIGANASTISGASNQFMELGNHPSDLLLSTLKVGEENRGSSGTGVSFSSNYFGFANGTLDATELRIGLRPGNPASAQAQWRNTVNIGGGIVTIGSGGILMCTNRGTGAHGGSNVVALNISGGVLTVSNDVKMLTQISTSYVAYASINITGGTNTIYGNIFCGNNTSGAEARVATLTLNGNNAVLDLTGHVIGGTNTADSLADHHVDVLNLQAGTLLNVSEINSGGTLTKSGTETLNLGGTNSYSGATVVSEGTLNVVGTNFGAGNVTVNSGATLSGTGSIRGAVAVNSGGALTVGGMAGTPATLSISNDLTLGGTTRLRIMKGGAPNTDLITGIKNLTYGGALVITNVGGTLANGDQFKLFDAASYSGSFSTVTLPTLTPGLYWDTNALVTSGTIQISTTYHGLAVVRVPSKTVRLHGTGNEPGGTFIIVTSTNLWLPVEKWEPISTNKFGADASYDIDLPVNSGEGQRFYQVRPAN